MSNCNEDIDSLCDTLSNMWDAIKIMPSENPNHIETLADDIADIFLSLHLNNVKSQTPHQFSHPYVPTKLYILQQTMSNPQISARQKQSQQLFCYNTIVSSNVFIYLGSRPFLSALFVSLAKNCMEEAKLDSSRNNNINERANVMYARRNVYMKDDYGGSDDTNTS